MKRLMRELSPSHVLSVVEKFDGNFATLEAGLKEADKDLKSDSFKRQILAPLSIRALILEDATEIRTEAGVGGSAATVSTGEACKEKCAAFVGHTQAFCLELK